MYRIAVATRNDALLRHLGAVAERQATLVRIDPEPAAVEQAALRLAPDLVLLDCDIAHGCGVALGACATAIADRTPGLKFAAIGDERDAAGILAAVRAGAAGFIGADSTDADLADQFGRLFRSIEHREAAETGRLSVIFSGRPNEGESLFAINLAVLLAREERRPGERGGDTVLIDCTLPASECDVALDLEATYSLRDALHDLARMDRTLLTSTLARHAGSGLYVLPLALAVESVRDVQANSLLALVGVLRGLFADVVLNIGSFRHAPLLRQFCDQATVSYAYVTQSFSALRACHGVLQQADIRTAERHRMVLIVADYDPAVTLSDRQIGETMGLAHMVRLPPARAELLNSLNAGQPLALAAPRSAYVTALARIAALRATTDSAARPAPAPAGRRLLRRLRAAAG